MSSTRQSVSQRPRLTEFSSTPLQNNRSLFPNPLKIFNTSANNHSGTGTNSNNNNNSNSNTNNTLSFNDGQYYHFYENEQTSTLNGNVNVVYISPAVQSLRSDVERYIEKKQRSRTSNVVEVTNISKGDNNARNKTLKRVPFRSRSTSALISSPAKSNPMSEALTSNHVHDDSRVNKSSNEDSLTNAQDFEYYPLSVTAKEDVSPIPVVPIMDQNNSNNRTRSSSRKRSLTSVDIDNSTKEDHNNTLFGSSYTDYSSLLHNRKEQLKLENRMQKTDSPNPSLKRSRSAYSLNDQTALEAIAKMVEDTNIDKRELTQKRFSLSLNKFERSGPPSPPQSPLHLNIAKKSNSSSQLLSQTLKRRASSKQFWMPDNRVTTCYQCQTPFSVLKRKHHCRVCGLIFCWKCSNNFINGEQYGYSGRIRVCGHCLGLLTNQTKSPSVEESFHHIEINSKLSTDTLKKIYNSQNVVENFTLPRDPPNDIVNANNEAFTPVSDVVDMGDIEVEELSPKTPQTMTDEEIDGVVVSHPATEVSSPVEQIPAETHLHPSSISGEEFEKKFDEHLRSIEESSQQHLRAVVTQLLQDDTLDMNWRDIIVGLALRVVNCVNPQPVVGDKMDIRHYVKIKKIPGTKFQSEYVDGIVFKKNVAHKRMRANISHPKLLLFSCPIEYQRVENQISSFDILLDQEEEFLKLLVARIAEKKPDLVIVQKPVSRVVQEMLVKCNISLMVNVKRSILERISRATGYPILSSVDEIDLPRENAGVCTSTKVTRTSGSWANKTLYTITGTKAETGCTIILRGEDLCELKQIKKIMRFAVFVAYNLRLEAELFFDECGTLTNVSTTRKRTLSTNSDKSKTSEEMGGVLEDELSSVISPGSECCASTTARSNEDRILSVSPNVLIPLRFEEWTHDVFENGEGEYSRKSNAVDRSILSSKMLSPLSHQNIVVLFTKVLKQNAETKEYSNSDLTQQEYGIPEIIVIAYYTENDMTLGKYLETKCFNQSLLKENLNVIRTYTHDEGRIKITIESSNYISSVNDGISMWSYCKMCQRHVTPVVPMSEGTYKYSFGKFLETALYNHKLACRTGNCNHAIHKYHIRCFGYKDIITKIEYEPLTVYRVAVPPNTLPYNHDFQRKCFEKFVDEVSVSCTKFYHDLLQCANDMESNPDYIPIQDQIYLFRSSVQQQHENLSSAIEAVRKEQNMYRLNDMIRNIYITAKTWNSVVTDLVEQSKDQAKQMSNKTKKDSRSFFTRRSSIAPAISPARTLCEEQLSPGSLSSNNLISVTLASTSVENRPIKVLILEAKLLSSSVSYSSLTQETSSRLAIPRLSISPSTHHPHIISPCNHSPPSPFDSHARMTHSVSLSSISTSTDSVRSPMLGNAALIAPSITNKIPTKIAPVEIPRVISNVSSHMFLQGAHNSETSIIVYEEEPSTIIAYTLSSADYHRALQLQAEAEMWDNLDDGGTSTIEYDSASDLDEEVDEVAYPSVEEKHMSSRENCHFKFVFNGKSGADGMSDGESGGLTGRNNTEGNSSTNSKGKDYFYCTCYFAKHFSALRKAYCNGDEQFIHSLSRCIRWTPTGGKSKSTFTKTWDDRFVVKQISRVELLAFLETGLAYFDYMVNALFHELPTVLSKIVGVYRIGYFSRGRYVKQDVIVMDNLFYNRKIDRTYDLKGSVRNRYQKASGAVLLDENLLESIYGGSPPLITRQLSKGILTTSIHNDTLFLSKLQVMDYSLLVGVDEESKELVVGIIDYVRQYTWDKHLETWVKSASSKGKVPTVISPKNYKIRFREAMERYFLLTPDKFTGLLQSL